MEHGFAGDELRSCKGPETIDAFGFGNFHHFIRVPSVFHPWLLFLTRRKTGYYLVADPYFLKKEICGGSETVV